jgi:hypothetical protein
MGSYEGRGPQADKTSAAKVPLQGKFFKIATFDIVF